MPTAAHRGRDERERTHREAREACVPHGGAVPRFVRPRDDNGKLERVAGRPRATAEKEISRPRPTAEESLRRAMAARTPGARARWARQGLAGRTRLDPTTEAM